MPDLWYPHRHGIQSSWFLPFPKKIRGDQLPACTIWQKLRITNVLGSPLGTCLSLMFPLMRLLSLHRASTPHCETENLSTRHKWAPDQVWKFRAGIRGWITSWSTESIPEFILWKEIGLQVAEWSTLALPTQATQWGAGPVSTGTGIRYKWRLSTQQRTTCRKEHCEDHNQKRKTWQHRMTPSEPSGD